MIRPELVKQLETPAMGLAVSWTMARKNVPCKTLQSVADGFKRECWPFVKGKVNKSNAKAKQLREQGNEAYKKVTKDKDRALELYNQSICFAEEDSEELGIGYANRSAIYFNRQMYNECLQNIHLAKRHHYPEQMMQKLDERRDRCLEMQGSCAQNQQPPDGKEEKHCSIKSCLEMSDDSKGIRTSRDLDVGEKVLLEKPFLLVLEYEVAYQRCDYCGARNGFNLLPCKGCTAVMYCSGHCQEQAFQRYHQFECEIVDDLQLLFRGPKPMRCSHLALRLFWHGVLLYLEDPVNFPQSLQNPAELSHYSNPFALEPSDYFLYLYQQGMDCMDFQASAGKEKDLTGICVSQFFSVLIYAIAVEENTSLSERLEGMVASNTLRNLLYALVYQSSRVADYGMADVTCLYPFSRLVRHSCAPTAQRIWHDLQSIIVVKRPVRKGEEITVAYEETLTTDRTIKTKRQERCCKEYQIEECDCEGCKADYPLLTNIEKDEELEKELRAICATEDEAQMRSSLLEFLQRHNNQYPKRELAEAWTAYKEFLMKDL